MKYSVITPMFNSFEHMGKLFAFIEKQTRTDIEYVFVDDCSTDDSYAQLQAYCEAHFADRAISLKQTPQNCGPGGARNVGMECATGEWIVFLDSDDTLQEDFFDRLDAVSDGTDINFILFDCNIYNSKGTLLNRKASVYGKSQGAISVSDIVALSVGGIRKSFKKELLIESGVRFPLLKKAEDFAFFALLVANSKQVSAYYLKEALYFAYQRKRSLSRGNDDRNVMPKVFSYLYENINPDYKDALTLCSVRLLLYGGLLQMAFSGCRRKELKAYYQDYCKNHEGWKKQLPFLHLNFSKKIAFLLIRCKCFSLFRLYAKLHRKLTTR